MMSAGMRLRDLGSVSMESGLEGRNNRRATS